MTPYPFGTGSPVWFGVALGLVWREILANVFVPVRRLADQWFAEAHERAAHRRALRELEPAAKEDA